MCASITYFQENLCLNPKSIRQKISAPGFLHCRAQSESKRLFPLNLGAWLQSGHTNWKKKKSLRSLNISVPLASLGHYDLYSEKLVIWEYDNINTTMLKTKLRLSRQPHKTALIEQLKNSSLVPDVIFSRPNVARVDTKLSPGFRCDNRGLTPPCASSTSTST